MTSMHQIWEPAITTAPLAAAANELRWYAIHTRARHEKKVTTQLKEKDVIAYLPLIAQRRRWSDRNKTIQMALFPCYTFVQLNASPEKRLAVLRTPGVVGFVGLRGVGLPIPDKEIEDIQTVFAHNVTCVLYPFLRIGQRVRIRGGCLEGVEGILVGKNFDRSLVVSVELIQRSVAIRLDGYDVEPA